MADLVVYPSVLEKLAAAQTEAAKSAAAGAGAVSGTGTDCWVSHGVISGSSNSAFGDIEEIRKAAGEALADGSGLLAAKLRTAKAAYEGVDGELQEGLDKQMLDK